LLGEKKEEEEEKKKKRKIRTILLFAQLSTN
jgi:hypothetical protein